MEWLLCVCMFRHPRTSLRSIETLVTEEEKSGLLPPLDLCAAENAFSKDKVEMWGFLLSLFFFERRRQNASFCLPLRGPGKEKSLCRKNVWGETHIKQRVKLYLAYAFLSLFTFKQGWSGFLKHLSAFVLFECAGILSHDSSVLHTCRTLTLKHQTFFFFSFPFLFCSSPFSSHALMLYFASHSSSLHFLPIGLALRCSDESVCLL